MCLTRHMHQRSRNRLNDGPKEEKEFRRLAQWLVPNIPWITLFVATDAMEPTLSRETPKTLPTIRKTPQRISGESLKALLIFLSCSYEETSALFSRVRTVRKRSDVLEGLGQSTNASPCFLIDSVSLKLGTPNCPFTAVGRDNQTHAVSLGKK